MPANKNALERYLIIDEKLRSGRRYSLDNLAQHCSEKLDIEVSPRTISDDLKYMRNRFSAPIPKRPTDNLFAYMDKAFSIMTSPLKEKDVIALKKVLHILQEFEYLPQFHDIQEIILNLESRGNFNTTIPNNVISFDRLELKGIDFLRKLYECIIEKQPSRVGYVPYEGDHSDEARFTQSQTFEGRSGFSFHFHPYFLKEYNSRWFVFGWNEEETRLDCYALDRFDYVTALAFRPYKPNEITDFSTYFDALIGVTNNCDYVIQTFCLRFRKPRAFYVRTKLWKPNQKEIEETEESITFEWQLQYNRELEARVLEFGQDVEVLAPQWFREKIAGIWENAFKNYSNK